MKRAFAATSTLLLAAALGVAVPSLGPPPASATVGCGFLAATSPNVPIPDGGTVTSTVDLSNFADADPIIDLDVGLDVAHTFDSDLEFSLSYKGTTVALALQRGGSGDNFTNTRFDDGASTSVRDGSAPFTGSFRPEQTLNAFDGLDLGGIWTLTVRDRSANDTGTLQAWSLVFRTQWCEDSDRDGVRDLADMCPLVKGVWPHGCPVRPRTVSILYNNAAHEFRGVLRCPTSPTCAHGQPVRVYKEKGATDQLVGRTFASDTGTYALPKTGVSGTYYALAPKVVEQGVAECKLAQSPPLVI